MQDRSRADRTVPTPGRLTARVQAAYRAQRHAWIGHGLVLGVFVGLVLLCLAFLSGAQGLSPHPLAIAGVGAACTGLLVYAAGHRAFGPWAQRLDQRLRLQGALLAGLQAEAQGLTQPVEQLFVRDLLPKVERRRILQEGIHLHLWLLALPFLAGALLLHNVKGERTPDVHWQAVGGQLQGLQQNVDAALAAWQEQAPTAGEVHAAFQGLSREVRRLAVQEALGQAEQVSWAQDVQALAEAVEDASRNHGGIPEVDQALAQAQNRLDWVLERAREHGLESPESARENDPLGSEGPDGPEPIPSDSNGTDLASGEEAGGLGASAAPGTGAGSAPSGDPGTTERSQRVPEVGSGADSGQDPTAANPSGPSHSATELGPLPEVPIQLGPEPPRAYRAIVNRWLAGETPP